MSFKNKRSVVIGLFILVFALVATAIAKTDELDEVIEGVRKIYKVQHLSITEFQKIPSTDVIIFDVRKLKEYQVSHFENAVHLEPGTDPETFFRLYGEKLKGKTAVFYCSVGQRSSKMLSKLNNQLTDNGVTQAYNLEGGAFKWHNDNFNLTKDGKPTRDIHPYNSYWGKLIKDKASIKHSEE